MRISRWTVALLILGILGINSCSNTRKKTKNNDTNPIPVKVTTVRRGDIKNSISLTGNIEPWKEVNIVPDVPGKVAKIYVKEGDRVKRGQVLAELDTRAARLQLQQAEAGLAVAQANFNSASKDWERMQELHQKGTVSPQQYEKVQLAYEAAKAQLQQAKAMLDLAKHQLEVSVMKAPFDGVITGKNINEGEYINPAMSGMGPKGLSVVTLMDLSRVKIKVNVSERDMGKIHIGQKAKIAVDSYPGRTFLGRVSNINPAADPMTRSFAVEVAVPNPRMELRAGMFARVEIITAERKDVLLIPLDSVISEEGSDYVYVVQRGKAFRRPVKLGLRQEPWAELVSGLEEGEEIVIVGKEMLRDGADVAVEGGEAQ